MHCFTANSFYKQTCEYSCSKALMSRNINLLSYHFTIPCALHSYETINRKVNCGLTPIGGTAACTPTGTNILIGLGCILMMLVCASMCAVFVEQPCLLLIGFNACQLLSCACISAMLPGVHIRITIFYVALLLTLLMQVSVNYPTSTTCHAFASFCVRIRLAF